MRLIRRHLLLTLAAPFVYAWLAQTGMLMLNQLSRRLGELVGKGLPTGVVVEVLVLFIPFIVALTLPMAVLVAVLYGFSQMGADNELTAMRANGVSVFQMLRPALVGGMVISAGCFVFIDQVLPRSNLRLLNLQADIGQKKPTFALKEQAVNNLPSSQYFLIASRIEPGSGRMREIVIYDLSPPTGRRVIYADSGMMAFQRGGQDLGILLYLGRVNEYKTGEPASINVTRFATNTVVVRNVQNAFRESFGQVEAGDREMTTCQMLDRVAKSREDLRRASAQRQAVAENGIRAMFRLPQLTVNGENGEGLPTPQRRQCAAFWLRLEEWIGRLLLPQPASAQQARLDTGSAPVIDPQPQAPPAVQPPSRPAVLVPAQPPTISEVTSARDSEGFARRDLNQYLVEIHKKLSLSVACVNFVLIGIALALRFPRGGMGLVIGASLVIFAVFYVGLTAGENFADRGTVSPALSMWLPNIIVFVAGVLGLIRVNREFGSTRGGDLADLGDWLFGWIPRLRRKRA
ncbi:MAG: LptF/LptG family permease [Gemmatimonadales bacterium]